MDKVRILLFGNKVHDQVLPDVQFIVYYSRIHKWVEAKQINGSALHEAEQYLRAFENEFFDRAARILKNLEMTVGLLEAADVSELLHGYQKVIAEKALDPDIAPFFLNEQEKIFRGLGFSTHDFIRQCEKINENASIFASEKADALEKKYSREKIQSEKTNPEFYEGLLAIALGLGTTVANVVYIPPSIAASICATTVGGFLADTGGKALLSD
jgi:hypothetical protein